ncbi:Leucine-rich repeat-containing G-protein coupled receptor 4 [Rhizoctonia solani]|uniref:Leucine-rich repeat-containing G-protein coupled receptor 4 n=1 Tax=Rhizoctonia solani TaxID=456999 RepID=A0A0K6FV51_9AGAM|nr:Leucine-rich repeat-containing G-protein coupled receptor 4 [Rhizoctonia solani]
MANDNETIVNVFIVPPSDESNDEQSADVGFEERDVPETEVTIENPEETSKTPEPLPDPHPALLLEDVLRTIFDWADTPTRAAGAAVSRRFMRPALAALWHKPAKIFDVLNLIAPLEREPSMLSYCFARPIMPSDWARFTEIYAPLIHEIQYTPAWSTVSKKLSASVFDDLSRSRLQLHILPNLTSLQWYPNSTQDLRQCEIFLSPSLRSLDVSIPTVEEAYIEAFFAMTKFRAPNLRVFQFECQLRVTNVEQWLCDLLETCKSLRGLGLSHYFLTTNVLASASKLPELEEILLWSRSPVGEIEDVMGLDMHQLQRGSFPKLHEFSLDASLAQMRTFVSMPAFNPETLTYLHVTSIEIERPNDIQNFLELLVDVCHPLETLVLSMLVKWVEITPPPRITMEHIRPILNFKRLLDFDVTYNYPFYVTDADLKHIASSWPTLRTLMLSEYPYFCSDDIELPSLGSLIPFAEHCPNLVNLGLFVNASLPVTLPSTAIKPFEKLQLLNFGQSYIQENDVVGVASLVSRLCDPSVQIKMGHAVSAYSFSPCLASSTEETPDTDIATRNERWEKVVSAVTVLQQARQIEVDRIKQLEARLAELEAKLLQQGRGEY